MLSPNTQTNLKNAQSYFEEHLAVGDYYSEGEQVTCEWIGAGAARLELGAVVGKDEFLKLCENRHPQTGERLTQRLNDSRRNSNGSEGGTANRRVFFDFTFSPPKSVSVAALVFGDARIVGAHRVAVRHAVKELERFAATRVRQSGSNADRVTGNIVGALFEHETSRALDPHLHTHCIIFNATHDAAEDRWKALQNYPMLSAQKYVENVYYHELAGALRRCGYAVENSARGDFELTTISRELCARFSKRHREIDAQLERLLTTHPEKAKGNLRAIRERLAHKERSRKQRDILRGRLRELWNDQLTADERGTASKLPTREKAPKMNAADAVDWAEAHLFERRSVVHEHELWRYALERARGSSVTIAEIKTETEARPYVREGNGKLTRQDVLAREWRIVCLARDGAGQFAPFTTRPEWQADDLADDQRTAFERIVTSRDFVTLFRGGAGTGKSYLLRRVQSSLEAAGHQTLVLAPQRQQVLGLEQDGLARAQTVAAFLTTESIPERSVVIVDEAGQIGAGQLLGLLDRVRSRGGRVILSGDTRQHGPVEASDALRAIERYSGLRPAELSSIRRQDPARAANEAQRVQIRTYREAVKQASAGDVVGSFDKLERLGAVTECSTPALRADIASTYIDLAASKQSAIVVSQTWEEIDELNDRIRAELRARKFLASSEESVTSLRQIDLTTAQKQDRRFYPDDHMLVFNRNVGQCQRGDIGRLYGFVKGGAIIDTGVSLQRLKHSQLDALNVCKPQRLAVSRGDRLQLKANAVTSAGAKLANGELVTVRKIKPTGEITLTDGRVLPASYRQFVRGYAVTSYGSQGKTVDHVLFADSAIRAATNAQQWYVSISRGRKSVRIFTPDKDALRKHVTRSGERALALDLPLPTRTRTRLRNIVLPGMLRGRALAKAICLMGAARRRVIHRQQQESVTV
jgi:conjugative relaxase-like TrwC/TraI family protein